MLDELPTLPSHGTTLFRGLHLDAFSLDLPEGPGQLGDRASHRAFDERIDAWRHTARRGGPDPFGPLNGDRPHREKLDDALVSGTVEAAGIVHSAIEDYAGALTEVVRRFLVLPEWQGTQRVLIGGGLRSARIGEVAIGRAGVLLRAEGVPVRLTPIRHHPDEAGLIGALRLVPPEVLAECDAVLTADLGGTSFRAGAVLPRLGVAPDLKAAGVWRSRHWRHDTEEVGRADALGALAGMLGDLASEAAGARITLAPVVAVGLPGVPDAEGRLVRGAENLPGDWHEEGFRPAEALARLLPLDGGGHPTVVLHNDAVLQGLSEAAFLRDVSRWGVLTVGTGLGNARFTNRAFRR